MVAYWSQIFYNSAFLDLKTAKQKPSFIFLTTSSGREDCLRIKSHDSEGHSRSGYTNKSYECDVH